MLQPTILLLKEGTDTSQGVGQLISNINACEAIVATVRTTLGPRGMDILVQSGSKVTITNDGATLMKLLDVVHPAAKTLVDIARSQDDEVGDGTTSVVVLAGEFLSAAKTLVEEGLHPQVIMRVYRQCGRLVRARIKELAVNVAAGTPQERRTWLERCAATALQSKLIGTHAAFFATMVVDAVEKLDAGLDLALLGVKKEVGGGLEDSLFVEGVAFKKTFSYAGAEQQPKQLKSPKILLLNVELELKAEKENAEIKVAKVEEYQSFVDAEWNIIYTKLRQCVDTGAKVVLSRLAIGDLATQYFADRGIFCAGRVPGEDLARVAKATGGAIQASTNKLSAEVLGTCDLFEERQVGKERYNFFTGCPQAKTATILLRGGGEQFIDEAERSLHDAIMVVRRAHQHTAIVAGGGAVEMELSRYLLEQARAIPGKEQLVMKAYARAFEAIPRQLSLNAGFDATELVNRLRHKHAEGGVWWGIDIGREDICDCFEAFVLEPALIKLNSIEAATEAAALLLSADYTVQAKRADGKIPEAEKILQGRGM